jgi:NADH-quinone oxidoreductase subunit E
MTVMAEIPAELKKWVGKRGALIMALHDLQDRHGYVPREDALAVASAMDVPLARIYEVLTFYNYFKLERPGDVVISICTGTACHMKGASKLVDKFKAELAIEIGETTPDRMFHLQCVRCVGCCGLAPAIVVNGKTYGKVKPSDIPAILAEWRERVASGETVHVAE